MRLYAHQAQRPGGANLGRAVAPAAAVRPAAVHRPQRRAAAVAVRAVAAPPEHAASPSATPAPPRPPPPAADLKPVPRLPGQLPLLGIMHRTSVAKAFEFVSQEMQAAGLRMAEVELLGVRAVRLRHPEDIARVARDTETFVKLPLAGALARWLGEGLATTADTARHAAARAVLAPGFRPEAIRGHCKTFAEVAAELAEVLLESGGAPVDVEPLTQRATLDVIGRTGFGYDFRALAMARRGAGDATGDATAAAAAPGYTKSGVGSGAGGAADVDVGAVWKDMMPAGMLAGTLPKAPTALIPGFEHFERGVAALEAVAAHMVKEHRAGRAGDGARRSLLAAMLAAQEAGSEVMTDAQIRDELMTLMLAGSDTTATTLAFALWELSRRPSVLAAITAEVDAAAARLGAASGGAASDAHFGADDVATMPLLCGAVNESLRLYSAAPSTRREAAADAELGGYLIPKGAAVSLDIWALHRHEDFWPRAAEWLPERWLPENAPTLAPHQQAAFLPFSVGPRACIGRYFALLEAQVVLAELLRRVSLSAPPGAAAPPAGPAPVLQALTLASDGGLVVECRPRQ